VEVLEGKAKTKVKSNLIKNSYSPNTPRREKKRIPTLLVEGDSSIQGRGQGESGEGSGWSCTKKKERTANKGKPERPHKVTQAGKFEGFSPKRGTHGS